MIEMNAFAYCLPLLDIFVIISWIIDTRYYFLQAEMDLTITC